MSEKSPEQGGDLTLPSQDFGDCGRTSMSARPAWATERDPVSAPYCHPNNPPEPTIFVMTDKRDLKQELEFVRLGFAPCRQAARMWSLTR